MSMLNPEYRRFTVLLSLSAMLVALPCEAVEAGYKVSFKCVKPGKNAKITIYVSNGDSVTHHCSATCYYTMHGGAREEMGKTTNIPPNVKNWPFFVGTDVGKNIRQVNTLTNTCDS